MLKRTVSLRFECLKHMFWLRNKKISKITCFIVTSKLLASSFIEVNFYKINFIPYFSKGDKFQKQEVMLIASTGSFRWMDLLCVRRHLLMSSLYGAVIHSMGE